MQRTPSGLPCGMPGIGEEIDGAMQQAPQPARQVNSFGLFIGCMVSNLVFAALNFLVIFYSVRFSLYLRLLMATNGNKPIFCIVHYCAHWDFPSRTQYRLGISSSIRKCDAGSRLRSYLHGNQLCVFAS